MGMVYNIGKREVLSCLKKVRQQNGELRDEQVEELLMKKIEEVHLNLMANKESEWKKEKTDRKRILSELQKELLQAKADSTYCSIVQRGRANGHTTSVIPNHTELPYASQSMETKNKDSAHTHDYEKTLRENAGLLADNRNLMELNRCLQEKNAALEKEIEMIKREANKMEQDVTREMDELRHLKLQLSQQLQKVELEHKEIESRKGLHLLTGTANDTLSIDSTIPTSGFESFQKSPTHASKHTDQRHLPVRREEMAREVTLDDLLRLKSGLESYTEKTSQRKGKGNRAINLAATQYIEPITWH